MTRFEVSNSELRSVREAMRGLSRMLDQLDNGEEEKFVLINQNQLRAVVLPIERYAELKRAAENGIEPGPDGSD